MTLIDSFILGIVEGLTEFLPISSTGHLILTSRILGLADTDQVKAFEVIIQAGAILAVIWHYRARFHRSMKSLAIAVLIAFVPAAVLGLAFGSKIKAYLFGPLPVVIALILGGIAMIVFERRLKTPSSDSSDLSPRQSLSIGFAQCLALCPGVSRSMATILGGRWMGLSPLRAAEFSFFLAIPTLLAASAHDAWKYREVFFEAKSDWLPIAVGMITSFICALIVIRAFLKFLTSHSMEVFGWYRIILGVIFGAFLLF